MADVNVGFGATDLFALGGDFEAQESSNDTTKKVIKQADANGDYVRETEVDTLNQVSCTYTYTGSDLGAALDAALKVGQVKNAFLVDEVTLTCKAQEDAKVTVTGHQHGSNAHAAGAVGAFDGYDLDAEGLVGSVFTGVNIPAALPLADGGSDSACVGLTLKWSGSHEDLTADDGEHSFGRTTRGEVEVTQEHVGTPSLTTTGWEVPSSSAADKNSGGDTTTVRASKSLASTVVPEA